MKIILAHKFFRMTGGTEKYFQDLSELLKTYGHEPIPFALQHPDNPPSPYEKYFLPDLNYRDTSLHYRLTNATRMIGRTLYSWESRRHMEQLISEHKPNLAHLQSIEHHISPSIIHTLRKHNLPIVQSLNTYKLVCASYRLFLLDKEEICERCLYNKHHHALFTRCVKNSFTASFLAMLEMYFHQAIKIYHLVDRFIVSSNFMAQKLVAAGYPQKKIVRLFNPFTISNLQPNVSFGDYILYFGRLEPEKGVATLIKAMAHLTKLKLIIVGSGSQMTVLQNQTVREGLKNIEFTGPIWGNALTPYLQGARLVVVPSEWYEPSPYVIYQSLAFGKPVVGANIGGIPDLLTTETGVLFTPGDVSNLVNVLQSIAFDEVRLKQMGKAARKWAEVNLDPNKYYIKLMRLYEEVIDEHTI